MTEQTQRQLNKAKALLVKAEDPAATTAEREAYTARAMALLSKYGIDQALLHASGDNKSEQIETREYWMPAPYAMDKVALMNAVAMPLRCKAIYLQGRTRGGKKMYVTGYTSDLDRVEMIHASLLIQMYRALAAADGPMPGENTTAYRKSFFAGFATEIRVRLQAAERRARHDSHEAGTGTDIVLADRKNAVEREYKRRWSRVTSGSRSLSGSGGGDGRSAGRRADLGGSRVGGSRRAIGS